MKTRAYGSLIGGRSSQRLTLTALGAIILMIVSSVVMAGSKANATTTTCTPLTQGYWKNHTSAWFTKIKGLTLGTTFYTDTQLLKIFKTPPKGDASLILAHQLIAALLNLQIIGTDPTPISATITDANTLLGAGPIPEHVPASSTLGQQMVNDASILDSFNNGLITTSCGMPVPVGSCQPSSSLSVLVSGTNVTSYVPKGAWGGGATGVSVVNVEGSSIVPTLIPTANVTNSCASNSVTGQTVCTANNTDVYLLTGTTLGTTLTSGGSSTISFSGGSCTNCSVAMDGVHNKALIGLSIAGVPGFQFLNLGSSTFDSPVPSPAGFISEDPLIDPINNLLLSASEGNNYEIASVATTPPSLTPLTSFFENPAIPSGGELDSSGEDCSTEIALAPAEFTAPSNVYIADLKQATFTAGAPGTWSTPGSQVQTLSESFLSAGPSGIAVAQGTHTGIVSGEFGGDAITAIALPTTSGSGTPAISDWVTCSIGSGFDNGLDPHTVTAYQSPNGAKDAFALLANAGATTLAVVDLTQMLNTTTVPRTLGGHGCASGTLPATVVSFVAVP